MSEGLVLKKGNIYKKNSWWVQKKIWISCKIISKLGILKYFHELELEILEGKIYYMSKF